MDEGIAYQLSMGMKLWLPGDRQHGIETDVTLGEHIPEQGRTLSRIRPVPFTHAAGWRLFPAAVSLNIPSILLVRPFTVNEGQRTGRGYVQSTSRVTLVPRRSPWKTESTHGKC